MNKQERLDFFNEVKGKKIKLTCWNGDGYFVPSSFDKDVNRMSGNFYTHDKTYFDTNYSIYEGFNDDYGSNWEYYKDQSTSPGVITYTPGTWLDTALKARVMFEGTSSKIKLDNKCRCDMQIILMRGCECGGV